MNWPGPERWLRLWTEAGATGEALPWHERLSLAYAEPQRHYHNQQHIAACLAEFDEARALARHPIAVEFALWFHDAVYDPRGTDNETQSAALAADCLQNAGLGPIVGTVEALILATQHTASGGDPDTALLVDIDLSILGKDPGRFAEYEAQIRREYEWVPGPIFNSKRAEILRRFLEREHIYATRHFAERYEQPARRNLEASIQALKRWFG